MKVVIVADIDITNDVNTCVLGYSSKDGWEEVEVTPKPLPQKKDIGILEGTILGQVEQLVFEGWNACLEEIEEH